MRIARVYLCRIVVICVLFNSGLCSVAKAQDNNDDTINVIESLSDSTNLVAGFFDVYDSLGSLFFNPDSIESFTTAYSADSMTKAYGGDWSNDILFLFDKNFDPAKMVDSIKIILQDNEGHCYSPPRIGGINSGFGWRRWQFHYGMDIQLSLGDTVRAAFDGVIRISKWGWGYGNCIVIRHNNGLETLYGHLSASRVVPNQPVKAGDVIGLGGSTGRSTGPHLHFEIRYLGVPINPTTLIDFTNYTVLKDTVYLTKRNFQYYTDIKKVAGNAKYYTIRSGDTLSKIALKCGSNVATICAINGIKSTTILQVGRTIRVR